MLSSVLRVAVGVVAVDRWSPCPDGDNCTAAQFNRQQLFCRAIDVAVDVMPCTACSEMYVEVFKLLLGPIRLL